MWNCKNCGTSLDDSVDKCPFCGYNFVEDSTEYINDFDDVKEEKTLKTVGSVILLIGIISSIILFIYGFMYLYSENSIEQAIAPYYFGAIIPTFIISLGAYALFNVISNISLTLKEIKENKQ